MLPIRFALASVLLVAAADLQPAEAQVNIVNVDVTFPPTLVGGDDLVVSTPVGVGLPAIVYFAPTSILSLTTEIYATDLGAQLSLFTPHTVAFVAPDLTATWATSPIPFSIDLTVFVAAFASPIIFASNLGQVTVTPSSTCPGTPGFFQESNKLVVMEIESAPLVGQWAEESALPGFTGSSYYRWTGPNLFSSPGTAILHYPIEITNPGTYRVKIHNRHNHPASDMENDCWISVDGGPWEKFVSNAGTVGAWNWAGGLDFGGGGSNPADYFLGAGTHNIRLSARSFGYHMDRMHVYIPGQVSDPLGLSQPVSCLP